MSEARQLFMEVSLAAQKQGFDAMKALNTFRGPQGPQGDPGSIDNLVINGKKAVPINGANTINLTAADVDALPKGGTAVNADKLNGKDAAFYIQPRNILDNPDCAIAQAGYNALHGSVRFVADRWESEYGSVKYNKSYFQLTTTSTLKSMKQKHVVSDLVADSYTFALLQKGGTNSQLRIQGISGDTVTEIARTVITGIGEWTLGIVNVSQSGLSTYEYVDFAIYNVSADTIQYKDLRLFEGTYTADNLPPYVPKGYAVELMACEMYDEATNTYIGYLDRIEAAYAQGVNEA